ncbi:hypothetical protein [Brevundimonas sp.]|uniref:hypothetical protein n=1 Tax=Brevundimonas sp. TaxID=1871086 RepID=UPI002D47CF45|nr:hypothetical protein [Brevundimonas sp.]HYC69458.1 hypothetical protein [Brevundimonas sp.]
MTPDQKLEALFAADRPPARDYAFEVEIARRVAKRRAWLTALALLPWSGVAALLLWALDAALAPVFGGLAAAAVPLAMPLALAGTGVAAAVWLTRRFSAA